MTTTEQRFKSRLGTSLGMNTDLGPLLQILKTLVHDLEPYLNDTLGMSNTVSSMACCRKDKGSHGLSWSDKSDVLMVNNHG